MNWDLVWNFTFAMIAIFNPLGIIPIWTELTGDKDSIVRIRIAALVILTTAIILILFLIFGKKMLTLFSVDLPSFQVAGGILLLLTGIRMIEGMATRLKDRKEDGRSAFEVAKKRFEKVVVPLGIPMLAGPGSITTVLVYGTKASTTSDYVALSIVLLASLLILFTTFAISGWLEKKFEKLIFTIFTRIFGLFITAIAIQFILEAMGKVVPQWMQGG